MPRKMSNMRRQLLEGLYFTDLDEVIVGDEEVVGMLDIQAKGRELATLKQVPVSVAQVLLRAGQEAIDKARDIAKKKNLPGTTARDGVYWKLQWHAAELSKPEYVGKPAQMYNPGNDLKQWTMAAYVEANAAEEGAVWIDQAWNRMMDEIKAAIAALPVTIAKKINETTGALLGIPLWAWAGGVATLTLVGMYGLRRLEGRVERGAFKRAGR